MTILLKIDCNFEFVSSLYMALYLQDVIIFHHPFHILLAHTFIEQFTWCSGEWMSQ